MGGFGVFEAMTVVVLEAGRMDQPVREREIETAVEPRRWTAAPIRLSRMPALPILLGLLPFATLALGVSGCL